MQDIEARLKQIEERLFALEKQPDKGVSVTYEQEKLEQVKNSPDNAKKTMPLKELVSSEIEGLASGIASVKKGVELPSATRWMAWCAGLTFILAITYFLKLVYDTGWLTPVRQMGLAATVSFMLITVGLVFEKRDRQYASFLPAVGLVGLYLVTFAGNLYYQLIDNIPAMIAVGVITLLGIWLGRYFRNSVYIIFSAVGVYITPLLIHADNPALSNLVIYYSAWSILFAISALQEQRRLTYLLPMYLAMLGFDVVWRMSESSEWVLAASYQLIQFLIFATTTVAFSVLHKAPIGKDSNFPHGLALFIFYGLEYSLLEQHIPESVNYIAVMSGVVVYLLYFAAQKFYKGDQPLAQGAVIVSYYCSMVAVHAVFFGIVPESWFPWAVMVTPAVLVLLEKPLIDNEDAYSPVMLACGGLFLLGYVSLLFGYFTNDIQAVPAGNGAVAVYVLILYSIYFLFSKKPGKSDNAVLALYAGHLALMALTIDTIQQDIFLSAVWAIYAVGLLVFALTAKDKVLGQSALLLFLAAGLKVLIYDLSGGNSMIRVVVLLALSGSLYVGGALYQSLVKNSESV